MRAWAFVFVVAACRSTHACWGVGTVESAPWSWNKGKPFSFRSFVDSVIPELCRWIESARDSLGAQEQQAQNSSHPYFNFIPPYVGSVALEKSRDLLSWSTACFGTTTVVAAAGNSSNTWEITFVARNKASTMCYDWYLLATVSGLQLLTLPSEGVHKVTWGLPADVSDAEVWDLSDKGVRVYRFLNDKATTLANLGKTVELFLPLMTAQVPEPLAELSRDFIETYTHFTLLPKRTPEDDLYIPEAQIQSGDFFGILRLDGLDPMLAWGMGSTTGHTTVALWIDDELYITESQVASSYWPTDGVQKTPYKQWIKQAHAADFNVVHVPLTSEARSNFNETAAVEFFKSVEGLMYGYETLLWGWIDTLTDNYPCLPPDYSSNCLQWELIETVFGVIDRYIPEIADLLYIEAWNLRLGTEGLRVADLYLEASEQGLTTSQIPLIVEQDEWLYNTTRYGEAVMGKSMVCCVYVCNLWKAAGVFSPIGSELNCGELTNWDDYSLSIVGPSYTQIMGAYTVTLNDFSTKEMHEHMAESCPSLAPDYEGRLDC